MPTSSEIVEWAASRWFAEVSNRPLRNVHRRSLDDTWRQVIRHFGGDDIGLCGPTHDDLVNAPDLPSTERDTSTADMRQIFSDGDNTHRWPGRK